MARPPISRSAEAGFSLIELMVTLTLVAAIAAFAIPATRAVMPGYELRQTAEALAGAAKSARREAMAGAREGWIELDLGARRYRQAGAGWRDLPAGPALRVVTSEQERLGADRGRIRFFPEGGSTGGAITLSAQGRSWEVTIDWLTGAVRLTEGEGA